ncbi:hypothetical protein FOZ63_017440, partial [Perkinsus olseni]
DRDKGRRRRRASMEKRDNDKLRRKTTCMDAPSRSHDGGGGDDATVIHGTTTDDDDESAWHDYHHHHHHHDEDEDSPSSSSSSSSCSTLYSLDTDWGSWPSISDHDDDDDDTKDDDATHHDITLSPPPPLSDGNISLPYPAYTGAPPDDGFENDTGREQQHGGEGAGHGEHATAPTFGRKKRRRTRRHCEYYNGVMVMPHDRELPAHELLQYYLIHYSRIRDPMLRVVKCDKKHPAYP